MVKIAKKQILEIARVRTRYINVKKTPILAKKTICAIHAIWRRKNAPKIRISSQFLKLLVKYG